MNALTHINPWHVPFFVVMGAFVAYQSWGLGRVLLLALAERIRGRGGRP